MKIFIIDDDSLSIFVTKTKLLLENSSFDVRTFLSASEALNDLRNSNIDEIPDVILLDLNMPIMDGWDFLDALIPLPNGFKDKCEIYVLTSSLDDADVKRAKSYALVAGVVHKPLQSEDIKNISKQSSLA